jgi:enoyl-CoA hydratase/carnithine racemase
MLQRLKDDLTRDIDNLRVINLTANGKVFSAGHDLKELVT